MPESIGVAAVVTEFLMQSVGDVIRVFPCWPNEQDAIFTNGLDQLVFVGTNLRDKARPRWKLNRQYYRNHSNELEMVKEVQK
jgi:hypothetical protein